MEQSPSFSDTGESEYVRKKISRSREVVGPLWRLQDWLVEKKLQKPFMEPLVGEEKGRELKNAEGEIVAILNYRIVSAFDALAEINVFDKYTILRRYPFILKLDCIKSLEIIINSDQPESIKVPDSFNPDFLIFCVRDVAQGKKLVQEYDIMPRNFTGTEDDLVVVTAAPPHTPDGMFTLFHELGHVQSFKDEDGKSSGIKERWLSFVQNDRWHPDHMMDAEVREFILSIERRAWIPALNIANKLLIPLGVSKKDISKALHGSLCKYGKILKEL